MFKVVAKYSGQLVSIKSNKMWDRSDGPSRIDQKQGVVQIKLE
jgi:hypothetical protein